MTDQRCPRRLPIIIDTVMRMMHIVFFDIHDQLMNYRNIYAE